MIRLTFAMRRKPGTSREEFSSYWSEHHGPMAAGFAQHLGALRYVQVHTLDDPINEALARARGGMEEPYDGVAELWWSSRASMVEAVNSPEGRRAGAALLEDEANFIDLPQSPLWFNYEYPQVNPSPEDLVARDSSPLLKLFFALRHPVDQSLDDAQLYWRTAHGPLIRSLFPAMRAKRYVQVHRYEDELEAMFRESRGTVVEPYTGHAELWIDRADMAAAAGTPESRRAGRLAIEDERTFIDFARSAMWVAKEKVFIDRR